MAESLHDERVRIGNGKDSVEFLVHIKNSRGSHHFKVWLDDKTSLIVSKPFFASTRSAIDFIEKNSDWILTHSAKFKPKESLWAYLKSDPIIYAGGLAWNVEFILAKSENFFVEDKNLCKIVFAIKDDDDASLKKLFIDFSRSRIERDAFIAAEETGLSYKKIALRDQSSRWASMSSDGTLSLNWRIPLLKPIYQNYILRHELAHTQFMNHSVSFWIFLNRIFPNAKRIDSELTIFGDRIFKVGR